MERSDNGNEQFKCTGKEQDAETDFNYFGARYYDAGVSVWLSVDPMAHERSWVSPYSYCQNIPIIRTDPTGALDWLPPTDGSGNWTAQKGDSPGSLARDAHITQAEAESAVKSANQARGEVRTSETMVYKDDVVNVRSRPGYVWNSGSSTTNSSTPTTPYTPSTSSNTSGSSSNPVQTVSNVSYAAGIVVSTAQGTVQNTQAGANFAYAISGNNKVISGVSNGFKYAPYVGLGVTVLTGYYHSSQINPATNQPYQSWVETGTDIGANIGTIYLGAQYGSWVGAGVAAIYLLLKAELKAAIEHPEYISAFSMNALSH